MVEIESRFSAFEGMDDDELNVIAHQYASSLLDGSDRFPTFHPGFFPP